MDVVADNRVGKWEQGSTIFNLVQEEDKKKKKIGKIYKMLQSNTTGKL